MPLTKKGKKIMKNMKKEYGEKEGKKNFYASANAGVITGVHENKDESKLVFYIVEEKNNGRK